MRWRRRRRLLLTIVAAVAAGLGILAHAIGVFHRTELQTIDARYQLRGARPALVKNFVVVGVDSSTLSYFASGKAEKDHYAANWPFPRRDDARVLDNLVKAGAKQIAVDIQFSQPTDNTDDADLETAIKHAGHVVLATTSVGPHGSTDIFGGNANLWSLLGHSVAADATVIPDSDGVYRRMQYSFQGLESFGTAIAAHMLGKPVSPKLFGGPTSSVPIDYAGPPGTVSFIPYWRVYTGGFPASMVRGKTVLVGVTASVEQDVHQTPMSGGNLMDGTEIVANEAATVVHGIPLRDGAGWVNVLLVLLLGCAAPALGLRGWALRAMFGGVIIGALYAVAAQLTFDSGRIIAVVDPEFALMIGIVGTLAVVYLGEAFERQYARSTFARFVPPGVVDEVLSSTDDDLRLAGVERVCTVMFSDLRGFTKFSETQPVEKVIAVVNHYLNEMTEAILDAGGTLIAYMGDGIMAVFGAPLEQDDHADRALRAAREMIGPRLQTFNDWLAEQGYPSGFRMGVGLNTGPVMCGNVGAEQRVEYTAIGDTTNTASRLEGMTKGGEHMLFVAEATRDAVRELPDDLEFVEEFEVRGREAKMRVYSIPDPVGSPAA
ncbi:MAG TPA: adenylate/guanylate cyclase domain-containing protein [Solirubrobacteraceae bacterium]|jgi:adenylate cyclase|nr:adenylate/guanylate cyclase domain-containing protein [Solirubrobacteraceae bacterium]